MNNIRKIHSAIGLLNSMVYCGEKHSEQSEKAVREALDILNNLTPSNKEVADIFENHSVQGKMFKNGFRKSVEQILGVRL